jgi:hypothetical protein
MNYIIPVRSEDFEGRFRRHLPRSNRTLIVLKGHLLMEELVNEFLVNLLPNPAALDLSKLNLSTRLRLVRAHLPNGAFNELFDAAEKLNTLRNKLAHHLEHPQIETHTKNFLRALNPTNDPELDKEPIERRLRGCISFLCGALKGACEAYVLISSLISLHIH